MYLLDTNIVLELLLDQDHADEVEQFLRTVPRESLHISEFSLYSVGIILFRLRKFEVFAQFLEDFVIAGGIRVIRLLPQDMESLAMLAHRFRLDFDDAYQYAVTEKYGLTIVSFDADFDRTERGRRSPKQVLSG